MTDYQQYLTSMRDEDGTPLYGIVMECGTQIIGIAVLRAEMVITFEYFRFSSRCLYW